MYRLTIILMLALTGATGHSTESSTLALELTDKASGVPVTNAVVILDDGPGNRPIDAEIVQENREFQPQTLVIPRGSTVDFPNRDSTQHHVYSFSPAKIFDIELYAGRPEAPIVFDRTGIVEIGCNIHDHMQAFILVTDIVPSGRTNDQGRLSLSMPPIQGDASGTGLRVWHPRMVDNTRMARFSLEPPYPDTIRLSVELSPEEASEDSLDSLQKRFREL